MGDTRSTVLDELDDVEVESPVAKLDNLDDMNALIESFEDLYAKMFTLAARPDVGAYHVTEVCVIAKVDTVKPKLRKFELAGKEPAKEATPPAATVSGP